MELKDWTYEEFPEFSGEMEDAGMIMTSGDDISARYIPNVEYCTVDGITLTLQILIPTARNFIGKETFPCIVYVQGSAWFEQNVYGDVPGVAQYCKKGYAAAIVQYRHSGQASFPSQIIDARNAVRFLRKHAAEYQIDPDKMFMAGNSSGGHTAVYAGILHDDDTENNLFPGISGEVKAIVNYYGSSSFLREDSNPITPNHNLPDSPEGIVMGGVNLREHPELVEKLSVECNITKDTDIVPVLHFHGTKDRIVNTWCTVDLHRKLKACGKESVLYLVKGADHGGADFWKDEIVSIVDEFLKKHV